MKTYGNINKISDYGGQGEAVPTVNRLLRVTVGSFQS